MYYILDKGHRLVKADSVTWGRWFADTDNRRVALTNTGLFKVSTVCLGLDHNFGPGPPITFETMYFERFPDLSLDGEIRALFAEEGDCWRYSTWDDAMAGHEAMVRRLSRLEATVAEPIRVAKEMAGIET